MKQFNCLAILILLLNSSLILSQDKPLLSEAIGKAIDIKGIESAKLYFSEVFESEKDVFTIDPNGISALGNTYAKNGNVEAANALMEIATPFLQKMILSSINGEPNEKSEKLNKMEQMEKESTEKKSQEDKVVQKNSITDFQGEVRNDLQRFTGLYGDPEETNEYRKIWVTVSCDGYLVVGALWGDVAPWWMKSESDDVFTYEDSFTNLKMEFVTDGKGNAVRMNHDL